MPAPPDSPSSKGKLEARAAVPFTIREDDLSGAATCSLLTFHLQQMHAHSPAGSVFALDLSGLKAAHVTVWTVWRGEQIVAVGAMKAFGDATAELKSMRTHPDHLRQGAAAALLEHIIAVAKVRGLRKLSLETGSGAAFEAALTLYRRQGFQAGEPFADYTRSAFNQFFHLSL
jgi:putative acetyltransferase